MYCSQDIHFGIESNLLCRPLNNIKGIIKVGVKDDDCLVFLNNDELKNPMLFPIVAKDHIKNTKYINELLNLINFEASSDRPTSQ